MPGILFSYFVRLLSAHVPSHTRAVLSKLSCWQFCKYMQLHSFFYPTQFLVFLLAFSTFSFFDHFLDTRETAAVRHWSAAGVVVSSHSCAHQ